MQPAGLIGGGLFVTRTRPQRVWTVAEAKAHLSEILRLAQSEGPQRIGIRRSFVVVPAYECLTFSFEQTSLRPVCHMGGSLHA